MIWNSFNVSFCFVLFVDFVLFVLRKKCHACNIDKRKSINRNVDDIREEKRKSMI